MNSEDLEEYSNEVLDRVSANVKKYRELRNLTQMQLALEIGMSGGAYLGRAEIRKDNHHFNIRHLAKISKVLDVDIKDFFLDHNYINTLSTSRFIFIFFYFKQIFFYDIKS